MARRTGPQLRVMIWGAAAFCALLVSSAAIRPVRDALAIDGDPEQIPWIWIGTFIATAIVSPLWSALLAHRARRRLVGLAMHVFAACAVVFFAVVLAHPGSASVGHAFYIWASVLNLFVVSVFWSLLADVIGPHHAKWMYGPIAAGGTIGTVIGPVLTKAIVGMAGKAGVAGVLLVSALMIEIAVLCVAGVRRAAAKLPPDAASAEPETPSTSAAATAKREPDADPIERGPGGAFTGIVHVAKSPYLASIVGYVLCTAFAATFVYLEQAQITKALLADSVARTNFFATIDFWLSVVTLALQLLVAGPALARFGPGVVLCVLPLVQVIGITLLTTTPSLAVLAVVQVIARSATHGLTRPARELLFTVISRDDKYRAKHAIDTIALRFGDVAAGWLRKGLIALTGGSAVIIGVTIPMVVLWLGLAAVLGVGFRRRVRKETA